MKQIIFAVTSLMIFCCFGCSSYRSAAAYDQKLPVLLIRMNNDTATYSYTPLVFRDTSLIVVNDWVNPKNNAALRDAKLIMLDSIKTVDCICPRGLGEKIGLGLLYTIPTGLAILGLGSLLLPQGQTLGKLFPVYTLVIGFAISFFLLPDPKVYLDQHNKNDLELIREISIYQDKEPEELRNIK
jgi:hypothetical protein